MEEKDILNDDGVARAYAELFDTSIKEARVACDSVHTLYKYLTLEKGCGIKIHKLWSMTPEMSKPKKNRHPKSGLISVIPPKKIIRFKMSDTPF